MICCTYTTICSLHRSFGPPWYLNRIPHNLLFHSCKHHCGSITRFLFDCHLYIKRKYKLNLSSWYPRNAALIGPSLSHYVCSETEILQCLCLCLAFSRIINILETIQLVSFFTRCEEETFIKAKLYGVQGVDVSNNTGTCWWSYILALSFCDNLLM